MYLSRVQIDTSKASTLRDLTCASAFHGWVENCFPSEIENHKHSRKLFRVDRLNGKQYLLLQSQEEPDTLVLEKYGVKGTGRIKKYDPFISKLNKDTLYEFKIVLFAHIYVRPAGNPVDALHQRWKIRPAITTAEKMKYFTSIAEKHGFHISNVYIADEGISHIHKSNHTVGIPATTYQGTLRITDIPLFTELMQNGFGEKKAYGFGMMTVLPVKTK